MTHAEALKAVWAHVATQLQGDVNCSAQWLERETEGETEQMRQAAGSVRRVAERCAGSKAGAQSHAWHRRKGGA
jgi:hypothetical protein